MEELVIKKQRQMTLSETFDFCLSSIQHRFFRSLLTLCVVILAVAFFMYLLCTNIFRNSVSDGVKYEIVENRKPSKLLNMLYAPCTKNDFVLQIVENRESAGDRARLEKITGMDPAALDEMLRMAHLELIYLDYFQNMKLGLKRDLFNEKDSTGKVVRYFEGREILEYLKDPAAFDKVYNALREAAEKMPDGGIEKMRSYMGGYEKYCADVDKAYAGWTVMRNNIAGNAGFENDSAKLRNYILTLSREPQKLEEWKKLLADNGFALSQDEVNAIIEYQRIADLTAFIKDLLNTEEYRAKWRSKWKNSYSKMDEKMEQLDSGRTLGILVGECSVGGQTRVLTEEDLKTAADDFRRKKLLGDLEQQLEIDFLKESGGFTTSQIFLMCLSFLVCVVGITNAMLMSITERFREIATLKCLGATDSFILIQIVLEAMIQGLIGGVIGLLLGFIVALTASSFQVGLRVFENFNWSMIGYSALLSLGSGMMLSVLSSLYPSTKAARMAPMEAMRVE